MNEMGFTFLSCLCPSALEIDIETIDSTRGILLYSLSRFLLLATCPSETENFKFFKSNNLKCSYIHQSVETELFYLTTILGSDFINQQDNIQRSKVKFLIDYQYLTIDSIFQLSNQLSEMF